MDVDILRQAALKLRDLLKDTTSVDPFEKSLTIASACNRVFRTLFLEADTIGIVPNKGYRGAEIQSITALRWLKWISFIENKRIQHRDNGHEKRILNWRVDGFCQETNTIYEFHGLVTCYFLLKQVFIRKYVVIL